MKTAMCLALWVLMSGLLAGCGQKGPLERPPETTTAVPSSDEGTDNR